jgi:hypothetical protein
MFLNSENTKIIDYLKRKNMYRYADAYLKFLVTGQKLDKHELKKISKLVRFDDASELQKIFDAIFLQFKIEVNTPVEKKEEKSSSNLRVKKYRDSLRSKDYKNLSVLLPASEYQKLKKMKLSKKMTYAELIIFLINQ